jgi:hypothetical protein
MVSLNEGGVPWRSLPFLGGFSVILDENCGEARFG